MLRPCRSAGPKGRNSTAPGRQGGHPGAAGNDRGRRGAGPGGAVGGLLGLAYLMSTTRVAPLTVSPSSRTVYVPLGKPEPSTVTVS